MKCRMWGMIVLTWVNRPIKVSNCLKVVDPDLKMVVMERFHTLNLCEGRRMQKLRVSMSHPSVFLISSRRPSASSFRRHKRSDRSIGSLDRSGLPMICIAKGTAAEALLSLMVECNETVMVLSIYTSAFPNFSIGTLTIIGLACPNLVEESRSLGGKIFD